MKKKNDNNTILFLAASLIMLFFGAFFFFTDGQLVRKSQDTLDRAEILKLQSQSTTDDLDSIETDLKDNNLENEDRELLEIEAEIEKSFQ